MEAIIQLEHVSRIYNSGKVKYTALDDVSLEIEKGSYVAVTGKSGSGKTTLLNMITGIDYPTNGKIQVAGKEISSLGERKLAKWRGNNIGIVFQFFQLLPSISVMDNLLLAMDFVKVISKKDRRRRAMELLQATGMDLHALKFPGELSGGEQQRVAISRALVNDPQILVADEPTGNLDSENTKIIGNIFEMLNKRQKTIVVITHEHVSNGKYDNVITLSDGKILTR